jgi:hypothetical protein
VLKDREGAIMSKQRVVGFGLRAALLSAVLVAACSAGGDSEKVSSVQEALTLAVPSRVGAVDFTAFNDSNTLHEGNCGSGPVDQQTVSDNGVTCGVAFTRPGEWLAATMTARSKSVSLGRLICRRRTSSC